MSADRRERMAVAACASDDCRYAGKCTSRNRRGRMNKLCGEGADRCLAIADAEIAAATAKASAENARLREALKAIVAGIDALDADGGMDAKFPQVIAARALLAEIGQ